MKHFFTFCSNSEASASELLQNSEEIWAFKLHTGVLSVPKGLRRYKSYIILKESVNSVCHLFANLMSLS